MDKLELEEAMDMERKKEDPEAYRVEKEFERDVEELEELL